MARRVRSRVFVLLLAVAIVGTGGIALVAARAGSPPNLPPVSAARLIASTVQALAARPSVSGMLVSHVDLGLPSLSDTEAAAAGLTGPAALLGDVNGDHRIRFWSSKDGVKIAELLSTEEISYTLGRSGAWLWSSEAFAALHVPFPSGRNPLDQDPQKVLDLLNLNAVTERGLQAAGSTTTVSVQTPVRVAGRDAYALVLTPKTTDTLVGRIEVDIDAQHRLPLRAAVFARGASSPPLSLGYRTVSFDPVDPSTFAFRPPTGAKVTSPKMADTAAPPGTKPGTPSFLGLAGSPIGTRVIGRGWSAVLGVEIRQAVVRPSGPAGANGLDIRRLLPLSGSLFSIRLEDRDGHWWLLFGAVPQSRLIAVGGQLP
jgi:hypothetical protein